MNEKLILENLVAQVKEIYHRAGISLPFHGWHHISFVYDKSIEFAIDLKANVFLVSVAALTHDLNYVVKTHSDIEQGEDLRREILHKAGLDPAQINAVEKIINEADISTRDEKISIEAKALSDADSLFKVLPVTPLFANWYASEQNVNIAELAKKIVDEQVPLYNSGFYFYSDSAKKYLDWAKLNIEFWKTVHDFFQRNEFSSYFNQLANFKKQF